MNEKKKWIAIILIVFILIISIVNEIQSKKQAEIDRIPDSVGIDDTVNISNIDTNHILYRVEEKEDYFLLKNINYPLMSFFKNVNEDNYKDIELNQEYVDFFNLSDQYLEKGYSKYKTLFYDILTVNKIEGVYLLNVNYSEEGSDEIYTRVFSIKDNKIIDAPFLEVKDVDCSLRESGFEASIASKATFDDYEVYLIEIENKTDSSLKIGSDMFGFYALDDKNKYYHRLVGETKTIYEVFPYESKNYYVRFDVHDPEEIYINVNGKDYLMNLPPLS